MLKKKVDGLEEYYYQWMNKYKDDADRRLKRLRTINAVLKEKGIKKPYQDELVRKLNVIQSIVEQELMLEAERQGDEYIESESAHHKLEDFEDA